MMVQYTVHAHDPDAHRRAQTRQSVPGGVAELLLLPPPPLRDSSCRVVASSEPLLLKSWWAACSAILAFADMAACRANRIIASLSELVKSACWVLVSASRIRCSSSEFTSDRSAWYWSDPCGKTPSCRVASWIVSVSTNLRCFRRSARSSDSCWSTLVGRAPAAEDDASSWK